MGDKLKVVFQDDDGLIEGPILRALRDDPRIANIDLVVLRDIIAITRAALVDHTESTNIADHIGLEHLGEYGNAAILWRAHPLASDWFARLIKEGHTGRRVLLREKDLNRDLDPSATAVLKTPITRQVAERIYAALGIESQTSE